VKFAKGLLPIILGLLLTSLLSPGCGDARPDSSELLSGTWVNTQVNGTNVPTDSSFVLAFLPGRVHYQSEGVTQSSLSRTWLESDRYTYDLRKDQMLIQGLDARKRQVKTQLRIVSLTQDQLVYTVESHSLNGTEHPDQATYTMARVKSNNSESLPGVWYGRCTTPGAQDARYSFWEFLYDGQFRMYRQDAAGVWHAEAYTATSCFLFGDLLVRNFTTVAPDGTHVENFDCWTIDIKGNSMNWTRRHPDGTTEEYRMQRAASAPEEGSTNAPIPEATYPLAPAQ